MFDFTLPYQINERRNLTFQLIFITVGMIAEVGVGDDLRAAAAGRTIVTGEIALLGNKCGRKRNLNFSRSIAK